MTIDDLRAFHRAEPFRPFLVRTDDGESFAVPSPEGMALSAHDGLAVVFDSAGQFRMVEITHIAEALPIPTPPVRGDDEPDLFA